jgi:hypothetical protein
MDSKIKHRWPELNEEERTFVAYWEKERERHRPWMFGFKKNLTMGIVFGAPIALFFFAEAPRHRELVSHTDLVLIMIGVVLTIVFYALFRGSSKWDEYESHYKILKMRENQDSPTDPGAGTVVQH